LKSAGAADQAVQAPSARSQHRKHRNLAPGYQLGSSKGVYGQGERSLRGVHLQAGKATL